jgi:uncharacterized protein
LAIRGLIRGYQLLIAPVMPPSCRYYPTCSHYAAEAVAMHGPWRGSLLALRRLLRCHPFSAGGYDPVPPAKRRGTRDNGGEAESARPATEVRAEPAHVPALPSKEAGEHSC